MVIRKNFEEVAGVLSRSLSGCISIARQPIQTDLPEPRSVKTGKIVCCIDAGGINVKALNVDVLLRPSDFAEGVPGMDFYPLF